MKNFIPQLLRRVSDPARRLEVWFYIYLGIMATAPWAQTEIFGAAGPKTLYDFAKIINVQNYGAKGDGINDDTVGIQAAMAAATSFVKSTTPGGGQLVGTQPTILIPYGIYNLSDHLVPTSAYTKILGVGNPILNQTVATKDILDFSGGYMNEVKGVSFVGGRAHIRFCNQNLEASKLHIEDVEMHRNNSAPMIEFYLSCSGSANLSTTATIAHSKLMQPYQAVATVAGVSFRVQDTWVEAQNSGISPPTMIDGGLFVNKSEMIFDRMYGVPPSAGPSLNARWVDNYGVLAVRNSRFGGEGSGMPIVYNFVGIPQVYPYVSTGSYIAIQNSLISMGSSPTNRGIVRFVTDIPQTVIIEGNTFGVHDADPYITADAGLNITTYINALTANNRIYFSVKKNQGWTPMNGQGWPAALQTADPTKIIFELDQQPLMTFPTFGGAAVTIDPALGKVYQITATNATAFTINVSLAFFANVVHLGQEMVIIVKNTSGAPMGAVTNGALLKGTAWIVPATGFSRSKTFRYDGTNFVQVTETAADVPN